MEGEGGWETNRPPRDGSETLRHHAGQEKPEQENNVQKAWFVNKVTDAGKAFMNDRNRAFQPTRRLSQPVDVVVNDRKYEPIHQAPTPVIGPVDFKRMPLIVNVRRPLVTVTQKTERENRHALRGIQRRTVEHHQSSHRPQQVIDWAPLNWETGDWY